MIFYMFSAFNGVCIFYNGFAVDSDKNIYLGKDSVIQVLSPKGEEIRSLNPITSRGYEFTIIDDLIFVDTGTTLYTMDLYGNIIQKSDSTGKSGAIFSNGNQFSCTASDGTNYIMKNIFSRTKICEVNNGEYKQVYIMPIYDFIAKLSFFLCIISVIVVLPFIIIKCRKIYSFSHM